MKSLLHGNVCTPLDSVITKNNNSIVDTNFGDALKNRQMKSQPPLISDMSMNFVGMSPSGTLEETGRKGALRF